MKNDFENDDEQEIDMGTGYGSKYKKRKRLHKKRSLNKTF